VPELWMIKRMKPIVVIQGDSLVNLTGMPIRNL